MKVLSLGMGQKIFEENSEVRQRNIEYGKLFDELHVIVFTGSYSKLENQKLSNNVFIYPTNSKIRYFYFWDYLKITKAIIQKVGRENLVVTTQDPFETGLVGLLLKLFVKVPLQVQVHTDFANKYFIQHSILNAIRFMVGEVVLSFADGVRVVSERIKKTIHNNMDQIIVLPINVESKNKNIEPKVDHQKISILTVARLEKEKDLETALKAFAYALKKGIEAEFVIVGEGSEMPHLKKVVKDLNIENKVIFAGWQNQTDQFYEKADIYVSTSLYEGYGMSTVEASFFSLPLILSRAGIAEDIFNDRESALVCTQGSTEQFGEAILSLSRNKNLRTEMGEKAKAVSLKKLISKEEYLELYKRSLENTLNFYKEGNSLFKRNVLLRYLVSGTTSAFLNIFILFIATHFFHIWYLYGTVLAFLISSTISFFLQKLWTFEDGDMKKSYSQLGKYMSVAVSGILINTALMGLLVSVFGIWYLGAQFVTNCFIAVYNFMLYKFFIFKK